MKGPGDARVTLENRGMLHVWLLHEPMSSTSAGSVDALATSGGSKLMTSLELEHFSVLSIQSHLVLKYFCWIMSCCYVKLFSVSNIHICTFKLRDAWYTPVQFNICSIMGILMGIIYLSESEIIADETSGKHSPPGGGHDVIHQCLSIPAWCVYVGTENCIVSILNFLRVTVVLQFATNVQRFSEGGKTFANFNTSNVISHLRVCHRDDNVWWEYEELVATVSEKQSECQSSSAFPAGIWELQQVCLMQSTD